MISNISRIARDNSFSKLQSAANDVIDGLITRPNPSKHSGEKALMLAKEAQASLGKASLVINKNSNGLTPLQDNMSINIDQVVNSGLTKSKVGKLLEQNEVSKIEKEISRTVENTAKDLHLEKQKMYDRLFQRKIIVEC